MRIKQKLFSAILGAVLLAPAFVQLALAATGVIYITPASSSLQVGSSETLQLRINPGTTVDGVQATVSYNTGYLQLNSVDTSSSPFTVTLQKSAGGGTITLALGNLSGGVSSDSLIATMNFTALAGSSSSSLTISGANATSSGSYTNPATSGASVSFTSPVRTQAPTSSGGGSSSSHASSGSGAQVSTPTATSSAS
ncbi:MAG TPA: cohesin domain-containing protein, partial [Verrucomicrobiae bacterium]|nr:cohesin domain-containing protein [Verrucomicrobiae bacterium]